MPDDFTRQGIESLSIGKGLKYTMFFLNFVCSQYGDRTYPMLILGSLMFIPGFYHVRIAYYAWKGYRGYSFDDIPDFD